MDARRSAVDTVEESPLRQRVTVGDLTAPTPRVPRWRVTAIICARGVVAPCGNRGWRYRVGMPHAPARPDHLLGSAWTRSDTVWRYRHWQVVARHGDEVELAAVLAADVRHRVPWRALRDRAVWAPGWVAIPTPT